MTAAFDGTAEWPGIEPIPFLARQEWCLPAIGGRVLVRGYLSEPDSVRVLPSPGWTLAESLVLITTFAASRTDGPQGEMYPGDCVVFVGPMDNENSARLWFPQRIVGVEAPTQDWQRVWSVQPPNTYEDEPVSPDGVHDLLQSGSPLRGNNRRRLLELFGLNLECARCGRYGERLYYGPLIMPAELMNPFGGDEYHSGDDVYACTCGARWHVADDGELVMSAPGAIL